MSRRERDEFGDYIFEEEYGGGWGDIAGKIFAKLTSETTKKIGEKALEEGIKASSRKIGEKTGDLISEKLEDKFGKKKKKDVTPKKDEVKTLIETTNTKGDQIVKELQKFSKNTPKPSNTISSQFDEILDM